MNKSEQTKQGLRKSFERGMSKKASVVCYGYERDKNDSLIINEAEANAVRMIYAGYLKGLSLGKIVDLLLCKGIISPSGKESGTGRRWIKYSAMKNIPARSCSEKASMRMANRYQLILLIE